MKWMTGIWLAIFLMSACGESDMEYQSIADLDGDSEELEKNGSENGDLDICPPFNYDQARFIEGTDNAYRLGDFCHFSYGSNSSCPDCFEIRNKLLGQHLEMDSNGCPVLVNREKICDTYCSYYNKEIDGKLYFASGCDQEVGTFFQDWEKEVYHIYDICFYGAGYLCLDGDIKTCIEVRDLVSGSGILAIRHPTLHDCGEKGCIGGVPGWARTDNMTPGFCVADEGPDAEDWPWESPNPKPGCPHENPSQFLSRHYYPCPAKTFCHNDMIYGCTVVEDAYGCPQETYVWEIEESSEPCRDYWAGSEGE